MGYTEKYLTSSFSRFAPNRVVLRRTFGAFNKAYNHAPYVPHFSMAGGVSLNHHQGGYNGSLATVENYIAPMYDMMAHQQHIIEQQQRSQQEQSNSVLAEQNTLIKEMFSSFESSFKSMLEAMSGMMATNNKLVADSQNHITRPRVGGVPEVFSKPVPTVEQQGILSKSEVANAPIHVGIDPDTGKISRQGSSS